jgi:hypothetical protein
MPSIHSVIFSVRFQAKKNVIPSEQFHHPTGKSSKEAHSIPLAHINIVCVTGNSPDLYLTQGGGVDFLHHMFWSFCVQQVQFSIVRSIDIGGISDLLSPLMLIQITRSSI